LVSGSDDFTLFFWKPAEDKKSKTRMTGHQQLVNQVANLMAVYQIAWSADSRLIVSGSADSTLKVLDWSPDGARVASGGKDKLLKLWRQ
uniref:WD_REPEATS_REGION domain-containing protein n=1 Tax=Gongylonema pulchrum TaxID=637853 RepID=A0A183E7W8_9BILA